MTSIIQSNRERKSRLDEGLVERLNQEPTVSKDIQKEDKLPPETSTMRFITNELEWNEIAHYMDFHFTGYRQNILLKYEDGVMKGSNTYIALMVNNYLINVNSEYRVATLAQLQQDLSFVKGVNVDVGIAVRSENYAKQEATQDKFVENILHKIKNALIPKDNFPVFMNIDDMHVDDDLTKFYIRGFRTVPSLNWSDQPFSKVDTEGFPIKPDEKGRRIIFTSKHAVARCVLTDKSHLATNFYKFNASSNSYRIVLAKQ